MKLPKIRSVIIALLIIIISSSFLYSEQKIKPEDLNLNLKNGAIDRDVMTRQQKDTILIGLFDFTDYLEDIAVYYASKKKVVIYQNQGTGYAVVYREIDTKDKPVRNIRQIIPEVTIHNPLDRSGIEINYADGEKEIYRDYQLHDIGLEGKIDAKVPRWDIFQDPRAFMYSISYIQGWQSERNWKPYYRFTVGDVDNDGLDEIIWTFWPVDTLPWPVFKPTRMVVFEYVNENYVRIDWDTIFTEGGFNLGFPLTDFNSNGHKEFFAVSHLNILNQLHYGFFECRGPGQYHFMICGYSPGTRHPQAVEIRDSVTVNGVTGKGAWMCFSDINGQGGSSYRLYRFFGNSPNGMEYTSPMTHGWITTNNTTSYHMSAGDLDGDGKDELILGSAQWGTGLISYLDSTGINTNFGYEIKQLYPNAPLSTGFSFFKDYDGDGKKELTTAGIGAGTGSLGVIKHTGQPGSGSFTTVWWDTVLIKASPNRGIDTNYIQGEFSLLYPLVFYENFIDIQYTYIYKLVNPYSYERIYYERRDSSGNLMSKFYDLGGNGKMNIIAPISYQGFDWANGFMTIFEMHGSIGINNISTEIPEKFTLYQNYPNPFNNETRIKFDIKQTGVYKLEIFDISGRRLEIMTNDRKQPGSYELLYDASSLSSGVYFYRLFGEGLSETKKFLLVK